MPASGYEVFIGRIFFFFFFSIRVFFHRHWRFTGQQGKGGDHLLFRSTLPPAREHSDIYLQLCMWDDYHIFTTLSNYHLIDWWSRMIRFDMIRTRIDYHPCITNVYIILTKYFADILWEWYIKRNYIRNL